MGEQIIRQQEALLRLEGFRNDAGFIGAIAVSGTSDREAPERITRVLARYLSVDCPRLN
jgi:uncharacterized protein (UPF0303 family)